MKKKKKSTTRKIIIIFIIVLIILPTFFGIIVYNSLNKEIDIALLKKGTTSVTKIFYYDYEDRINRKGSPKELTNEAIFTTRNEWCSIYEIPTNLKNAFIAIEDKRFFEHKGVDWIRTSKAFLNYILKFDKSGYGGSTITQQLIKNITGENDFSPKRKIEEIFRAINIEKQMSKNEILETYLNVVYMAENCYGVLAASKAYFNKNLKDLTLAECATLASIVQNPTKYDPYTNPENNRKRRDIVLNEMLSQNMISKSEYNEAIQEQIFVSDEIKNIKSSGTYSWYSEALLNEITNDLSKKYNLNEKSARQLILKGGLNIYSVQDPDLQSYAEKVYENNKAYFENQNGTYPQSSCVIIEPYTSDILAIVGGVGKKEGNLIYNRAIQSKRPLGSVIKPLSVYAPALEENIINYSTVYDDIPLQLTNNEYWPKNSPNKYRGLVPICFAVEHSINTVAVKVLRNLGLKNSINYLNSFDIHIDKEKDYNDSSLALGQLTNGESLLNVSNAYTAFANGGTISTPKTYLYVTDSFGNKILEKESVSKRVISEENAFIMTMMLKGVVDSGTAKYLNLKNIIDTAGKTGTSSNNADKWFIGYTPYYVCGVWTGYDTPKSMCCSNNPSCVIFDKIMEYAHKNLDCTVKFKEPINIFKQEFCFDSGKIPTNACERDPRGNRILLGYYRLGTLPKHNCHMHTLVDIDTTNGEIISGFVPFWKKRRISLLDYEREEINDIEVIDDEYLIRNRRKKN